MTSLISSVALDGRAAPCAGGRQHDTQVRTFEQQYGEDPLADRKVRDLRSHS
ncbi:hypothetical protein [Mycobacterium bourgelatii]|uniref:hypothetical protein n=1 Tax=Mycobacterium bourgelatii TaxID=1273442 RepID=UPI0013D58C98|nr:hypothetical protein [Mycobacterium bourgelatii]MCV6977027.1 hypothetical protein [Mycobacterium bourgelatii]